MSRISVLLSAAFLILGLATSPSARAGIIVVPDFRATSEGDAANCIPLSGCSGANSYQQLYAASQFSALSGPELITEIAFRPDRNASGAILSHAFLDVSIELSTAPVSQLGATFAANVGSDVTTVYGGPLSLSSPNPDTSNQPKPFGVIITLQVPFLYDPSKGDLLFEFRNLSGEATSSSFSLDATNGSGVMSRLVGSSSTATTGIVDRVGLITRFTTVPFAPAPEPGTVSLLALGLIGTSIRRLRSSFRRRIGRCASASEADGYD